MRNIASGWLLRTISVRTYHDARSSEGQNETLLYRKGGMRIFVHCLYREL